MTFCFFFKCCASSSRLYALSWPEEGRGRQLAADGVVTVKFVWLSGCSCELPAGCVTVCTVEYSKKEEQRFRHPGHLTLCRALSNRVEFALKLSSWNANVAVSKRARPRRSAGCILHPDRQEHKCCTQTGLPTWLTTPGKMRKDVRILLVGERK